MTENIAAAFRVVADSTQRAFDSLFPSMTVSQSSGVSSDQLANAPSAQPTYSPVGTKLGNLSLPKPVYTPIQPIPTATLASVTTQMPSVPSVPQVPPMPSTIEMDPMLQASPMPSASQVPPMPSTSQIPPMPSASQIPPMPSASQIPPMPSASQIPPMPTTSQIPPMPTTSQIPPMPTTTQTPEPSATPAVEAKLTPQDESKYTFCWNKHCKSTEETTRTRPIQSSSIPPNTLESNVPSSSTRMTLRPRCREETRREPFA